MSSNQELCQLSVVMRDHDQMKWHKIASGEFQMERGMDMMLLFLATMLANFQSLSQADLAIGDSLWQQSERKKINFKQVR